VTQEGRCGRCGTLLDASATLCPRCGARALAAAAPVPFVSSRPGPQRDHRLSSKGLLMIGAAALAVVVGGVSALAHVIATRRDAPGCGVLSCGTASGVTVTETQSYHSSQLGFDVHYPSGWREHESGPDHVVLDVLLQQGDGQTAVVAQVKVAGLRASKPNDQLVSDVAGELPSSRFQTPVAAYSIAGARVGDVDGSGTMFDTTAFGNGAQAQEIRLAAVAATRGSVSIVVTAIGPRDPEGPPPSQLDAASLIDYLLDQIVFPGSG
jgi:hypothetical protein